MHTIKIVSRCMYENLKEAERHIDRAKEFADEPDIADWYISMAREHLHFNDQGHKVIEHIIDEYKDTDDYQDHKAYADGMAAVWNDRHYFLIEETKRVEEMLDSVKK